MTDYLDYYMKRYNITKEQAEKRRLVLTENGTRTAAKEMIGEAIIKKFHLWDILFPENLGYKKVTNKKEQVAGADYKIFMPDNKTIYIDLKSCIGPDYKMQLIDFDEVEATDELLQRTGIPVEIYQNGIFTNTAGKLTDYMLYIICDATGERYSLIPYEEIRNFSIKHKDDYIIDKIHNVAHKKQHYPFTRYKSNNGSGVYAKKPVFSTFATTTN